MSNNQRVFSFPRNTLRCKRIDYLTEIHAKRLWFFLALYQYQLNTTRSNINQYRQCTFQYNNEERSRNCFCSIKSIHIAISECESVVLFIQNAKHIRCFILSTVGCPSVSPVSTLSHIRHDFRENIIEYKICFDFLYNFLFLKFHFEKK